MFRAVGVVSEDELIKTYRKFGARLQGHPTPVLPWVDVATGSLGQGLLDAVGIALAGKYLDKLDYHVWVLCGDGETAEGSMWEALDKASYYKLTNLTAIVDVNRLGRRGPTELGWGLDRYEARVEALGCRPLVIDGHDLSAIDQALSEARSPGAERPRVVLPGPSRPRVCLSWRTRTAGTARPSPPTWPSGPSPPPGGLSHLQIRTTDRALPAAPAITADPTRRSPCPPTPWATRSPPAPTSG